MDLVIVIAGMTAVTYLPRLLPLVLHGGRTLTGWQERALRLVPITAVGALLIPGGLAAVEGRIDASIAGLVAAVAITVVVRQPFIVVTGAVLAAALALLIG